MPGNINHVRVSIIAAVVSTTGLVSCITGYIPLCKLITYTGSALAIITAAGILILLNPRRWIAPSLALLASSTLVALVKVLVGAERPPAEEWLVGAEGPSFPSGHAAATAALWAMVAYVYRSPVTVVAGMAHVMAVSVSRVVLGVHYVRDVVAGALVGVVFTVVLVPLARRSPYSVLAFTGALSLLLITVDPGYRTPWLLLATSLVLGIIVFLTRPEIGRRGKRE